MSAATYEERRETLIRRCRELNAETAKALANAESGEVVSAEEIRQFYARTTSLEQEAKQLVAGGGPSVSDTSGEADATA